MQLTLDISSQAEKFLSKRSGKELRQLSEKIDQLCGNPFPGDATNVSGYASFKKVDQGEFRIIYGVETEALKILIVERRNDDEVYKVLRRMFK